VGDGVLSSTKRVVIGILLFCMVIGVGISYAVLSNYHHLFDLIKVVQLIDNEYIGKHESDTMINGAIQGIVKSLDDPYSEFQLPVEYNDFKSRIKGSYGGVGLYISEKDEKVIVAKAIEKSPAFKAGIKAGDIIAKVNDNNALGLTSEEVKNKMRGEIGTKVKITVYRKGKGYLDFNLMRENIVIPNAHGEIIKGTSIAYLALNQFTTELPDEVFDILDKLGKQNYQGLIIDLRDNPGGDLNSVVTIAQYFVPKGPIVHIDYKHGKDRVWASDGSVYLKVPIVVLVNQDSASASEILAGAIKDSGSGTLVGTTTYGKGVVQQLYPFPDGAALKLTIARYLTPKKHDINKKGVKPDIVIDQPFESKKDLQLEKAIQVMKEKLGEGKTK
jgi:carboxyl-terminal processing protease